MYMAHSQYS